MNARPVTGAGFTIVEVMIVLAISGLMFTFAINAMSGKSQQTEFDTGVDTLRSQLNQDLSSVSDGNYLALNNAGCSAGATGAPAFTTDVTPNDSCTVIGEVIAFSSTSYTTLPAIGRNYISGSTEQATDLTNAMPAIAPGSNYSQTVSLPYGLQLASDSAATISPSALGAFGLFSFTSFEGTDTAGSGGVLSSGSQHVEIFAIPGSQANVLPTIDGNLTNCQVNSVCIGQSTPQPVNPSSGISFCVSSGSNGDSALFTIGGLNSPSTATDQIYSQADC